MVLEGGRQFFAGRAWLQRLRVEVGHDQGQRLVGGEAALHNIGRGLSPLGHMR